jgi:uncharacterized protein YbaP (TraB family)
MKYKIIIYTISLLLINTICMAQTNSKAIDTAYKKWDKSLFWKVTPPGSNKPSYLYGTMHVSDRIAFKLPDTFYNALSKADIVALESDPSQWSIALSDTHQVNDFSILDPEDLYRNYFNNKSNAYEDAINIQQPTINDLLMYLRKRPSQVNGMLFRSKGANNMNYEEDTYLDLFIYKAGAKLYKQIESLEDINWASEQMIIGQYKALLDRETEKYNNNEYTNPEETLEKAYRNRDIEKLDSLEDATTKSKLAKYYMLELRNDTMVSRFINLNNAGKSVFAAIGAAHLPGKRGVLHLLKTKGYKVEPIMYSNNFNPSKKIQAMDSLFVPVSFKSFYTNDSAVSAKSPAYMMYKMTRNNDSKYLGVDMANGVYYNLTRNSHYQKITNYKIDSIFQQLDSLVFEYIEGSIIHKEITKYAGYPCYVIESKTKDDKYIKQRIVYTPLEFILQKAACPSAYLKKYKIDTFFNTLQINYNNKPASLLANKFLPNLDAIMPITKAECTKVRPILKGYNTEAEGIDADNDYYLFAKAELQNTTIEEDTFDFNMYAQAIASKIKGTLVNVEPFVYSDINADNNNTDQRLFSPFTFPFNSIKAKIISATNNPMQVLLFRNGKVLYYFLIESNNETKIKNFFSSIKYLNEPIDNNVYVDSNRGFKINKIGKLRGGKYAELYNEAALHEASKADYQKQTNFKQIFNTDFLDFEKDLKIDVSIKEISKFFAMPTIDSFWNFFISSNNNYTSENNYNLFEYTNNTTTYNKNSTYKQAINNGKTYIVTEYDSNSVFKSKDYYTLNGNKILQISFTADSTTPNYTLLNNTALSATFITDTNWDKYVLKSKIDTFFNYATSTDSLKKKYVKGFTNAMYTLEQDYPKIIATLDTSILIKKEVEVFNQYIDELKRYPKPQSYTMYEKLYYQYQDDADYQQKVLKSLAQIETKEARQLYAKLLSENPPIVSSNDYNDSYNSYFNFNSNHLTDSLKLNKYLFPDIITLLDYDEYKEIAIDILFDAINDSLIDTTVYAERVNYFALKAKQELRKLPVIKDDIQKYNEKEEEKKKDEDGNDDETTYAAPAVEAAATIARSYNNSNIYNSDFMYKSYSNPYMFNEYKNLKNYYKLLKPFAYKRNVQEVLNKIDSIKHRGYILAATVDKLLDSQKINTNILKEVYDSLPTERYDVVRLLNNYNQLKAEQFGIKTQLDAAILNLKSNYNIKEKDTLNFVEKIPVFYKAKSGFVYLFKIKKQKAKEWSYYTAGVFSKDEKNIFPINYFTEYQYLPKDKTIKDLVESIRKQARAIDRVKVSPSDFKLKKDNENANSFYDNMDLPYRE